MQLCLKKSFSLYDKKQSSRQLNPESTQRYNTRFSNMEQMILQKYNFSHRLKTNTDQKHTKMHSANKSVFIPNSHVIAISQLSKIDQTNLANSQKSLVGMDKIKIKQKQNSIEIFDYSFTSPPPRKISEYKDCIKRIEMNTTYRGFNFTKSKFYRKNHRYSQNQKGQTQNFQDINKITFKAAERKMIIQHIIEKGFARKMEDSLIKVRNEKKRTHNEMISSKNIKAIYSIRTKRSVIFSQSESPSNGKLKTLRSVDGKQHQIEPW